MREVRRSREEGEERCERTELEILRLEDQHVQQRLTLLFLVTPHASIPILPSLLPHPPLVQSLLQDRSSESLMQKKRVSFSSALARPSLLPLLPPTNDQRRPRTHVDNLHLRRRLIPKQLEQRPDRSQLESMSDRSLYLVESRHERKGASSICVLRCC